jgi:dihydroneopterin aldolase
VTPTVVKVGGSYARHPRLKDVVEALAQGGGRCVVVPGGGPFANCIRREQKRIGFDDRAAHRMAVLAMAQFGWALASFSAVLTPAAGFEAIRAVLGEGRVPVWLPLDLLEGDESVPETWEMTSDSLAAWLAARLGAERLIFLKRVSRPPSLRLADLVAAGVLDPLVPAFIGLGAIEPRLCAAPHITQLGSALAAGYPAGLRIELT